MSSYGRVQLRGRVQPGDAVRYRLPDDSWLYGLVEAVRAKEPAAGPAPAAVAQVVFPVTDQSLAPVRVDCDPDLLLPLADPELRAFLAANTGDQWTRSEHALEIENVLIELRAATKVRKRG